MVEYKVDSEGTPCEYKTPFRRNTTWHRVPTAAGALSRGSPTQGPDRLQCQQILQQHQAAIPRSTSFDRKLPDGSRCSLFSTSVFFGCLPMPNLALIKGWKQRLNMGDWITVLHYKSTMTKNTVHCLILSHIQIKELKWLSTLKENSFSTRSLWMWLSTDGFIIYFMCKHCTHARTNLHNVTVVQKGKGKKTLTKQIKKRNDPVRHF